MIQNDDVLASNDSTASTSIVADTNQAEQVGQEVPKKTFTVKAICFGLLSLLIIILFDNINEFYLNQRSLNAGFLPPGPLFLILSVCLVWNPIWHHKLCYLLVTPLLLLGFIGICYSINDAHVLGQFAWLGFIPYALMLHKPIWQACSKRMILNSRELILSLSIVLVGAWTAGAGLAQFHAYTHIIPWTKYDARIQQQKYESLDYVPQHLWPAGGLTALKRADNMRERQRVYDDFLIGDTEDKKTTPWDAWASTLLHWTPFMICLSACFIGLSLIVHQQWSKHEQLPYPLAKIAGTVFEKNDQQALPKLFYMRSFWVAFLCVSAFHGLRLLHAWWPNNFPAIYTSANFKFLYNIFPTLLKSGAHQITTFHFSFAAIGICYFLSREIGLTLGISKFLLAFIGVQVYLSTGTTLGHSDVSNSTAGAYIAYAAVILFTGRHYYSSVFGKAFSFKAAKDHEKNGVIGARLTVLAFAGLLLSLCTSFQLDFFLALTLSLLTLLSFIVFTRVICETGIPYLQINWSPSVLMTSMFGISSIGAAPLVIMQYITTAVFMDAKNAMMPFVSNSLKMADDYHIKLRRLCTVMLLVVCAAIVVSLCTRLSQLYDMGANAMNDGYAKNWVQNNFLNISTDNLSKLDAIGLRNAPDVADERSIMQRISVWDPDGRTFLLMSLGAIGVIAFFFLRFRFPGFALHPVMFLIWGTWPLGTTFYSFFIGWLIREITIRYCGDKIYQSAKPFFIGLIVGELFIIMLGSISGYSLYAITGAIPPRG